MSPVTFLRAPHRWLKAISDFGATTSGGPPFAYELCTRFQGPRQEHLDLSRWRVAFVGAEPIPANTLQAFAAEHSRFGFQSTAFLPCYGLAENSLIVSGSRVSDTPRALTNSAVFGSEQQQRSTVLSCGRPALNTHVAIVEPVTGSLLEDGLCGEIWVDSPSVCAGYWKRPEATDALFGELANTGARLLRTGDLGFVHQGELFVCGRLKDLVIRNGAKYFPSDLELVAEEHWSLRRGSCVVFATGFDARDDIVLLAEAAARVEADAMEAVLRDVVSHVRDRSGLQLDRAYFVPRHVLQKTPNGKRMRGRCRSLYLSESFQPFASFSRAGLMLKEKPMKRVPSLDEIRAYLATLVADIVECDVARLQFDTPLTEYGLDSTQAVFVTGRIEDWLGIELDPGLAWKHPTIDDLSTELAALAQRASG